MAKDKLSNIQKTKEKLNETKAMVKNLMTKLSILSATQKQESPPEQTNIEAPRLDQENEQKAHQPFVSKKLYKDYTPEDWAQVEADKQRALDIYTKQEAQYNLKLQKEADAKTLEAEFQEYIKLNPPSINQYKTPSSNTMREKDPVVIRQALQANDIFKESIDQQDQTIEKVKNINEHQITPNIVNYFIEEFGIDLGSIDLGYQRIDTQKAGLKGDTYAAVYLTGKEANNTLALSQRIYNAVQSYKGITESTINQESIIMLNGLTHEALHKLFNLDNRLSIDKGANFENTQIQVKHREGMVEYYAREVMITTLINNDKINFSQKLIAIDSIKTSLTYKEFVDSYDNYLKNLAIKFAFSSDPNRTVNYNDNRRYINKLAAQFFLSSDDKIISLAKQLGLPGIMEI
jgi:hypothetical protein